jgi:hypothetical protein
MRNIERLLGLLTDKGAALPELARGMLAILASFAMLRLGYWRSRWNCSPGIRRAMRAGAWPPSLG